MKGKADAGQATLFDVGPAGLDAYGRPASGRREPPSNGTHTSDAAADLAARATTHDEIPPVGLLTGLHKPGGEQE